MWAVIGANGFVGRGLCTYLAGEGIAFRALTRRKVPDTIAGSIPLAVPGYEYPSLVAALEGADVVVQLAGGAHGRNRETDEAALVETVLDAASIAGARRFIYVSSIKAQTGASADQILTEASPPIPVDAYGRGKLKAERRIAESAPKGGVTWTIIRPTLIYGPNPQGHLAALIAWLKKGRPLPLGAIQNRRSMVSLDALCSLFVACARQPAAAGECFIAADPRPVSTAELAQALKAGLKVSTPIWPVSPGLLNALFTLTGQGGWRDRLLGNLEVSSAKAGRLLGWRGETCPATVLAAMAQDWQNKIA